MIDVGGCCVPELRNVSLELRNVRFELRNVSFELRNVSFVGHFQLQSPADQVEGVFAPHPCEIGRSTPGLLL